MRRLATLGSLILVVLTFLAAPLRAQTAPEGAAPHVVAAFAEAAPRIDGLLDEAVWALAVPVTDFRQRQPVDLGAPTERTEMRVAYDANTLYVGLRLFDREPDKIRASILDRGGRIDKDDNVRLALDTFLDHKNAYIFEMNPLGTQDDALLTDERTLNWDWDGVYRSEGRITPEGWTLEVAIPFTTIRFASGAAPVMGIALQRTINRKNEEVLWPGIARDYGMGFFQVSQYARLDGLQNLQRGRGIEVKPYVLTGAQEAPPNAAGDRRSIVRQVGADAKVSLTSSLLLDLTVNTDFAQVEADAAQINLTRFNLFFPEKREFFLERAGLFRFGNEGELETFFSRRIGIANPLSGGARVTGQAGRVGVGVLNLQTRSARDGTPGANYSVARVQTALGPRASVGAIATNVEAGSSGYANRVAGADGVVRFWGGSSASAWATNVWERGGTAGGGAGGRQSRAGALRVALQRDVYGLEAGYTNVGREFNPGVGFVQRDDFVRYNAAANYRPLVGDGSGPVRRLSFDADGATYAGQDGRLQTQEAAVGATVVFRARDRVGASVGRTFERLDAGFVPRADSAVVVAPGRYRATTASVRANTDESRRVFARAGADANGFFGGTQRGLSGAIGVRFSRHLKGEATARYTRVDHPSGGLDAAVFSARFDAAASRALFARALVQYDNFSRLVRANVRLDWIHTPGSDLFVVFNTNYRFDPESTAAQVLRPTAFALTDRAGVVKLTYRIAI